MSQSLRTLLTGTPPPSSQDLSLARGHFLFTLGIGYLLGLFAYACVLLVLAGCSSKQGADVDLGLKAKVLPEPTLHTAPAPSTLRKSDPPVQNTDIGS